MVIKRKSQILLTSIMAFFIFYSGVTYAIVDPGTPTQPSIPEGECRYKNSGQIVECNVATQNSLVYMPRDSISSTEAVYKSDGYSTSTYTYLYKITIKKSNKDSGQLEEKVYRLSDGRNTRTTTTEVVVTGTAPTFPAAPPDPDDDPAGSTPDDDPAGSTANKSEPVSGNVSGDVNPVKHLFSTPGCDSSGVYTSGILRGVSCQGATKTKEEVVTIVKNIIEAFLLPIVGVLFITIIVVGGLVYITSGGNEESIKKAKKILTSGIVGLLIVTLSYTIIRIFVAILGGSV